MNDLLNSLREFPQLKKISFKMTITLGVSINCIFVETLILSLFSLSRPVEMICTHWQSEILSRCREIGVKF